MYSTLLLNHDWFLFLPFLYGSTDCKIKSSCFHVWQRRPLSTRLWPSTVGRENSPIIVPESFFVDGYLSRDTPRSSVKTPRSLTAATSRNTLKQILSYALKEGFVPNIKKQRTSRNAKNQSTEFLFFTAEKTIHWIVYGQKITWPHFSWSSMWLMKNQFMINENDH